MSYSKLKFIRNWCYNVYKGTLIFLGGFMPDNPYQSAFKSVENIAKLEHVSDEDFNNIHAELSRVYATDETFNKNHETLSEEATKAFIIAAQKREEIGPTLEAFIAAQKKEVERAKHQSLLREAEIEDRARQLQQEEAAAAPPGPLKPLPDTHKPVPSHSIEKPGGKPLDTDQVKIINAIAQQMKKENTSESTMTLSDNGHIDFAPPKDDAAAVKYFEEMAKKMEESGNATNFTVFKDNPDGSKGPAICKYEDGKFTSLLNASPTAKYDNTANPPPTTNATQQQAEATIHQPTQSNNN